MHYKYFVSWCSPHIHTAYLLILSQQALSVGLDAEGGGVDAQDRDSSKHGAAEGESVLDLSNAEEGVSGNAGKDSHIDEESDPLADAS